MRKCIILFLFICVDLSVFAQVKTYSDSAISEVLQKEFKRIGTEILLAANEGKINVYDSDSLNRCYKIKDLFKDFPIGKEIKGLRATFKYTSAFESEAREMKLMAVAPTYNPIHEGFEFSLQPMFYITFEDFKKIISPKDQQLVIILSNILFSTHDLGNEFWIERLETQIPDFLNKRIVENAERSAYHVYFTDQNLFTVSSVFVKALGSAFYKNILDKQNISNNFSNIYQDASVQNVYTRKSWEELTTVCENVVDADTIFCTPFDFNQVDKLYLSEKIIGLGYDYPKWGNYKKVRFYTKRENIEKSLPHWIKFIINNYL